MAKCSCYSSRAFKPRSGNLKTAAAIDETSTELSAHLSRITVKPARKFEQISVSRDGGISDSSQSPFEFKSTSYVLTTTGTKERRECPKPPIRGVETGAYERQHQPYHTSLHRPLTRKNLVEGRYCLHQTSCLHLAFVTVRQHPPKLTLDRPRGRRETINKMYSWKTGQFPLSVDTNERPASNRNHNQGQQKQSHNDSRDDAHQWQARRAHFNHPGPFATHNTRNQGQLARIREVSTQAQLQHIRGQRNARPHQSRNNK